MYVFDVSTRSNPSLVNVVDIPGTANGIPCRDVEIDAAGDVWVAASGRFVKMTVDQMGNVETSAFYHPGGNPISFTFHPITGHLFYSAINANFVGVLDPANPSTQLAAITDVCDDPSNSPLQGTFSPEGDLYVGCGGPTTAITDVVGFSAPSLVGISGNVDASSIGARKIDGVDVRGANHLTYIRVIVPPEELLQDILSDVIAFEFNKGITNALSSTLTAALASWENDRAATINQLEAFINQVEAMRGTQMTDAEADELIASAQEIIEAILAQS